MFLVLLAFRSRLLAPEWFSVRWQSTLRLAVSGFRFCSSVQIARVSVKVLIGGTYVPLCRFPSRTPLPPDRAGGSQYTLGLSAVEGAGWSGSWVFRVTYDAETDEVWFQTSLAQRKGAFGTTVGGDQVGVLVELTPYSLGVGVVLIRSRHAAVCGHTVFVVYSSRWIDHGRCHCTVESCCEDELLL